MVLDIRTRGFTMSLFTALAVEVPLAVLAVLGARRLLRLSLGRAGLRAGPQGRRPSLWELTERMPACSYMGASPSIRVRRPSPCARAMTTGMSSSAASSADL